MPYSTTWRWTGGNYTFLMLTYISNPPNIPDNCSTYLVLSELISDPMILVPQPLLVCAFYLTILPIPCPSPVILSKKPIKTVVNMVLSLIIKKNPVPHIKKFQGNQIRVFQMLLFILQLTRRIFQWMQSKIVFHGKQKI